MTKEQTPTPDQQLTEMLLALVPQDGSTVGNTALKRALDEKLQADGGRLNEDDYWRIQASLVASGVLAKGQGRGGSVRLTGVKADSSMPADLADGEDGFELQTQEKPATAPSESSTRQKKVVTAPVRRQGTDEPAQIIAYRHPDKRVNNPEP